MRLFLFALALLFVTVSGAKAQDQATVVASCGSVTLTAGTQHFRTIDTNGVTCSSGGGGGSSTCSQATAYLARTAGGNEGGNAANVTTLICGLVTDGVWSKLDALYVLAQQNQTDALLNLIGTSYPLTQSSETFVAYQGFTGTAAGINTGFNMTTAPSPRLVQNNGNIGVWLYANPDFGLTAVDVGTGTDVGDVVIVAATNSFTGFICTSAGGNGITGPSSAGLYVADRSSSIRTDLYFNSANVFNNANSTQTPNNANIYLLKSSNATISEAHFGASLGAAGNLALYNRMAAYMAAIPATKPAPKPPDESSPKVRP